LGESQKNGEKMTARVPEIKKAGLVGYGKLAKHLAPALVKCGIEINQWCIRNRDDHETVFQRYDVVAVNDLRLMSDASDIILLLVNDQAIGEVGRQLGIRQCLVCHTSGMTSVNILPQENTGVFYPLNTFNGFNTAWDYNTPIFLHAKKDKSLEALMALAGSLSHQVQIIAPMDLHIVHLAAVLAQNFSNHLIAQAEEILQAHQLDRRLIHPLLKTMVDNLNTTPAKANQTGPAVRRDQNTIDHQLNQLESDPALYDIYKKLTESIQSYTFH
jgi:predicted short-subunit dehydrogenase-like oxidoreductase (DUF2520 family)